MNDVGISNKNITVLMKTLHFKLTHVFANPINVEYACFWKTNKKKKTILPRNEVPHLSALCHKTELNAKLDKSLRRRRRKVTHISLQLVAGETKIE